MLKTLPAPEVVRCYFDDGFDPPLPAMALRWAADAPAAADQVWELPEDVKVAGPAPQRFGVTIQRRGSDTYAVRLLWDHTCLSWRALTRAQLLHSALAPLLEALGTDLWYLLDQPVRDEPDPPAPAA
jgi:hypothetical protein